VRAAQATGQVLGLLCVVVVHVAAHAAAARRLGEPVHGIVFGAPTSRVVWGTGQTSARSITLITIAGPTANLALAALLVAGSFLATGNLRAFLLAAGATNLIGLVNLVPTSTRPAKLPTDGRVLRAALRFARTGAQEDTTVGCQSACNPLTVWFALAAVILIPTHAVLLASVVAVASAATLVTLAILDSRPRP
jgi:hypothetical protein